MTDPKDLAELCKELRSECDRAENNCPPHDHPPRFKVPTLAVRQLLDAAERCEKAEAEIKRDEESTDRTWTLLGNTYGGSGTMLHEAVGRCLQHVADLEKRLAEAVDRLAKERMARAAIPADVIYRDPTRRDILAGMALQGMITGCGYPGLHAAVERAPELAATAVVVADSLIEQLDAKR